MQKLRLAVHKFTSCDGCQLAFLNAGEDLLSLSEQINIVHFAEVGPVDPEAKVDIAFVEGSISTPDEQERIQKIRANTHYLITIGACATAGGIQALRNFANHAEWVAGIYANPSYIKSLKTSTPIADHVPVDFELWGCPVNTQQVLAVIKSLLLGAAPRIHHETVCMECKRKGHVCVLVAKKEPCMGPVTQSGCGALCPGVNRACYGCYGPSENPNIQALGHQFKQIGLDKTTIAKKFLHINNQAPAFKGIQIISL